MSTLLFEFLLLGLVGGLLGVFYRNCLKAPNMIFNWWYDILSVWVKKGRQDRYFYGYKGILYYWWGLLAWAASPLGYCIYCSTTWITFFICVIFLSTFEVLPCWQDIVIGVIAASGMQHIVVCIACRSLIYKHPDLDSDK